MIRLYRKALWFKLFKLGVNGKILNMMRAIYTSVKSCVRHCDTYTELFDISLGLRQGEIMSPVLFSLFLEDMELYLEHSGSNGLCLRDLTLVMLLLYMQTTWLPSVKRVKIYNVAWITCSCIAKNGGLEVNVQKTKIIIFSKNGGRLTNAYVFVYNGIKLDIVISII